MPTTLDNLKEAFAGESQAFQKYSAFAKKAEQEGLPVIARLFRLTAQAEQIHNKAKRMFAYAVEAESVHARLYAQALAAAKAGKDLTVEFHLCPVCGYIEFGRAPEKCPVCGTLASKFIKG